MGVANKSHDVHAFAWQSVAVCAGFPEADCRGGGVEGGAGVAADFFTGEVGGVVAVWSTTPAPAVLVACPHTDRLFTYVQSTSRHHGSLRYGNTPTKSGPKL